MQLIALILIIAISADAGQHITDAYAEMKSIVELEDNRTETRTVLPLQNYFIGKSIKESFYAAFAASFDNSERSYINKEAGIDTVLNAKYMDNYLLKLNWHSESHKIYTHASYSATEEKLTSYGAAWCYTKITEAGRFDGAIRAGYDYFYHWTNSGRDFGGINLGFQKSRFNMAIDLERALVRSSNRFDINSAGDTLWSEGTNAGTIINAEAAFMLSKSAGVKFEGGYQFSNYQFGSLLFYSTNKRQLAYGGLSADKSYKRLIYSATLRAGYDDGGFERNGIDVDSKLFWKTGLCLGWDFGFMIVKLDADLFSNAVYQSQVAGIKLAYK
ncbi:MAG: hypothetical protein JNL74_19175 [Fibrobacteres bacterium]|nr:hypothetical protein [Fibrobacterota bacterium]